MENLKMNSFETNVIRGLLLTVLIGLLMACGGGGGGSASTSESVVAKGVITNMGSIWVNGVEYETPVGGSYSNDDSTSDTASYEVGQVVSLRGRRNDDGVSGTADEVEYEAEIEGAAGTSNTINGVTIITDQTLTPGTRYEVSGFWIDDTTLQATFIKVDDDGVAGIDEVKGFVEAIDPGVSLTVRGVVYNYTGSTVVVVGDYVEIHFTGTTATLVELEDDFFDNQSDGQEVEIEGAVNMDPTDLATCPTDADFMIDMTCIDWDLGSVEWMDGLTGPVDMVSGLRVEAEGHINTDGLLVAEKIKGRGNQVRITAIASSIVLDTAGTTGSLVVFSDVAAPIDVSFESGMTEIDFNGEPNLLLANPTEGLEIRGIRTGATSVLALRIKDDNSADASRQELRAEVDVDGADSTLDTITVMGISSLLDADTQLEEEDVIIASGSGSTTPTQIDSFLDLIDDDGIVNTTNGPNDVVEVRIDTTNSGDGSTGSPYAAKQVEIEREDD